MKYSRYSIIAIILHWLIAVLIIFVLILGIKMVNMPAPEKYKLYGIHKATGIMILVLSLFRLFWRITHSIPALPSSMALWERVTSKTTHWLFYFLMISVPFFGWAMSSVGKHTISMYGVFNWPFIPRLDSLSEANQKIFGTLFHQAHKFLGYLIIALLVLHILAALKHLLFNRDDIVYRMTLLFKPKEKNDIQP